MLRIFLVFFLGLQPAIASAVSAEDPAWLALLHFSGSSSSVNKHSAFFLSREGYRNPAAELAATLHYFSLHPEEAACRFPARAIYLGRVAEDKGDFCTRWRKYREAIHAKGAELVYAAAYISSPSSMYGHTLLKFLRAGKSEGEDLLDYTLNYGAKTGKSVGLPYVWLGLTGGFDGNYATAPFYLKVREYNFVENRDFWIYPLKLTPAEVALLVAHSWELRDVDFPYFFLHRNCSFYLLELLEVVHPGAHLTSSFPVWTVPLDTIRRLEKDNWLGTPRFRPSRYRRLKELRAALLPGEDELVEDLAARGETHALPAGRESILLDTAYELWRYQHDKESLAGGETERKLLAARAANPGPAPHTDYSRERPPEEGHASSRLGFGLGRDRLHSFAELSYRGTLHDLLADPLGYEDYSELSMGDFRARVEDGKIFLERADLLRLRSLSPREEWIPRFSWSFRGGAARAKEFACEAWACLAYGLEGGGGASLRLGPVLGFALAELSAEVGRPFDSGYRIGAGPTGGLLAPLWGGARALLEGEWRLRLMGSRVEKRSARFGLAQTISRQWETRVEAEVDRGYREGAWKVFYYF